MLQKRFIKNMDNKWRKPAPNTGIYAIGGLTKLQHKPKAKHKFWVDLIL